MAINKVVFGSETLIDLTPDSVSADKVLDGFTFHLPSGEASEGTCTYDSDTSGDTAQVAEILAGKTAHARGAKLTGTMPNIGKQTSYLTTKAQQVTISQGYHDGSGKVSIDSTEQSKLIANNIKEGVTILGVVGSYSGEGVRAQAKSYTPTRTGATVLPDSGYDYLSQVTVSAIPYVLSDNAAGGKTATIAGA